MSIEKNDINVWLQSALEGLVAHDEATGKSPSTRICVDTAVTAAGVQVEVWWREVPSRVASQFLWDAHQFLGADEADLALAREALPASISGKSVVWGERQWVPAAAPRQPPPLFQYQPQRLRMLMPFARALSSMGGRGRDGLTMADLQSLGNHYFSALQAAQSRGDTHLRARIEADTLDKRALSRGVELCAMFVYFEGAGRAIFDFPPLMSEMFAHTDIDQVPVSMLTPPYTTQYLFFGPQEGTEIRPGWLLDGAYVQKAPDGAIRIMVTAAPPSVEAYAAIDVTPEPVYTQTIPASMSSMSLGDAVDTALANTMAELRAQVNNKGFVQAAEAAGTKSRMAAAATQELEALSIKHAAYLKLLRLVVNGLCYLTGYPEDVKPGWAPSTPERLRQQATDPASKHKQKQNATSKLLAMGYTPIHLCGQRFEEQMALDGQSPANLSAEERKGYTWVRGHYLRQAHGPGMSLRKLQWRMPRLARMRKELESSEPTGHIYLLTGAQPGAQASQPSP